MSVLFLTKFLLHMVLLRLQESNLYSKNQSLVCYRYTKPQCEGSYKTSVRSQKKLAPIVFLD